MTITPPTTSADVITDVVDRLTKNGRDAIADRARPYPIDVICEALGAPRQDWRLFSRWASGPRTPKATDELRAYLDVMIADKCRQTGHDLLSTLIQLQVDGQDLTVNDLQVIVTSLVASAEASREPLPRGEAG
jgi:cytochrome P450